MPAASHRAGLAKRNALWYLCSKCFKLLLKQGARPFSLWPTASCMLLGITVARKFKIFLFLHCFCSASTQWAQSASARLFDRLSTNCSHAVDKECLLMHGSDNVYFKLHVHGHIHFYRTPHVRQHGGAIELIMINLLKNSATFCLRATSLANCSNKYF